MPEQPLGVLVLDWRNHRWPTRKAKKSRRQQCFEFFERYVKSISIRGDKCELLINLAKGWPLGIEFQVYEGSQR